MTIAYVDVDDTLVRSFGSKRIPMTEVIRRVRQMHEAGVVMYCWSFGGATYAQAIATEFGIKDCFVAFLPKPHLMIDDQHPKDWTLLTCLHPNQATSLSAEEIVEIAARGT